MSKKGDLRDPARGKLVLYEHKLTFNEGNLRNQVGYLYDLMECRQNISSMRARL